MRRRILFLITVCAVIHAVGADTETDPVKTLTEPDVKALFGFSYDDLIDQIVIISTANESSRGGGSGFIARQGGKTYIFTNQHVLLGYNKVTFKTASGRTLRPAAVELSYARDIARLPLGEEDVKHFLLSGDAGEGDPVVVMGNSGGGGVAREVFGQILNTEDDLIEVSAGFVRGNSGSPLVLTNGQVVGIASYAMGYNEDAEGDRTQRFCYRILSDDWKPVDWRAYNAKHGRQFREYETFTGSVELLLKAWVEQPYGKLAQNNLTDERLRNWATRHNKMIEDTLEFTKHGEREYAGYKQVEEANKRIKEEMKTRSRVLALLCTTTAKDILRLADQKSITGYQKMEYRRLAERLELIADAAEEIGDYLAEQDVFYIID